MAARSLLAFNTSTSAGRGADRGGADLDRVTSLQGRCAAKPSAPGSFRVEVPPLGYVVCQGGRNEARFLFAIAGIALALARGCASREQPATDAEHAIARGQSGRLVAPERRGSAGILDRFAAARPLVDWSRLGFILADAPKLERNFEIGDVSTATR